MATEAPVDDYSVDYTEDPLVDERPADEEAALDEDPAEENGIFEGGDDFDEEGDFHCNTPGTN